MTCRCESFNPGMTRRPPRSITRVPGARSFRTSSLSPSAAKRLPAMAMARASGRFESSVVILPLCRMTSAAFIMASVGLGTRTQEGSTLARPEFAKLLADEVRLFLEDPMAALLDDPPLGGNGYRFGAVDAVVAEGSLARPGEHRRRQFCLGEFACLFSHLRDVAIVVEAGTQVAWLPHLHDVALHLVFRDRPRVIGEIAKEVPQV